LIIAAVCLTVGLRSDPDPLAGPLPGPEGPSLTAPATSGTPAAQARGNTVTPSGAAPVVARSAPVALRIPAIDVDVSLSGLGVNPDGTVQVPDDFQEPGWFRLGPSPGEAGSAVILGHVDSYEGPAVFFRLRSLQAGDQIEVTLANGVVAHFEVDTVAMYPKDDFPAEQVYGSQGDSALQLVTCGGQFDSDAGSYLSNVVASTSLVATTPPSDG
jgi:LPXTG-site transpeptidase (sortase) family protein